MVPIQKKSILADYSVDILEKLDTMNNIFLII